VNSGGFKISRSNLALFRFFKYLPVHIFNAKLMVMFSSKMEQQQGQWRFYDFLELSYLKMPEFTAGQEFRKTLYFGRAKYSLLNYSKAVSSPLGDDYFSWEVLKSPSSKYGTLKKIDWHHPEVLSGLALDFRRRKTLNIEDRVSIPGVDIRKTLRKSLKQNRLCERRLQPDLSSAKRRVSISTSITKKKRCQRQV